MPKTKSGNANKKYLGFTSRAKIKNRTAHIDNATAGTSNVPLAHQSKFNEKLVKSTAPVRDTMELKYLFNNA